MNIDGVLSCIVDLAQKAQKENDIQWDTTPRGMALRAQFSEAFTHSLFRVLHGAGVKTKVYKEVLLFLKNENGVEDMEEVSRWCLTLHGEEVDIFGNRGAGCRDFFMSHMSPDTQGRSLWHLESFEDISQSLLSPPLNGWSEWIRPRLSEVLAAYHAQHMDEQTPSVRSIQKRSRL